MEYSTKGLTPALSGIMELWNYGLLGLSASLLAGELPRFP